MQFERCQGRMPASLLSSLSLKSVQLRLRPDVSIVQSCVLERRYLRGLRSVHFSALMTGLLVIVNPRVPKYSVEGMVSAGPAKDQFPVRQPNSDYFGPSWTDHIEREYRRSFLGWFGPHRFLNYRFKFENNKIIKS